MADKQQNNPERLTIAEIKSHPEKYSGKNLSLVAAFAGWDSFCGPPPFTRSDWCIRDETGGIYVIDGKLPEGISPTSRTSKGKMLRINGFVKVSPEGVVYIEASEINLYSPD